MALAEIALPPFMVLDLKEVKSVRIPYCNACRLPLHMLRLVCLLAFLGLMAMLMWVISDTDSKLKNSNSDIYLIVAAFFGITLLPFIYTAIKEFILGIDVFIHDGWFHYHFTKSEILEFLEDQKLCRHLPDAPQIYVADQLE